MSWILLLLAGLLEVAWAIGLKYSDGFTRPLISALTVAAILASLLLLSLALRQLPVGTAYAVWTGIGALGTVTLGILFLGESASPLRLLSILLLLGGLIGLKIST